MCYGIRIDRGLNLLTWKKVIKVKHVIELHVKETQATNISPSQYIIRILIISFNVMGLDHKRKYLHYDNYLNAKKMQKLLDSN